MGKETGGTPYVSIVIPSRRSGPVFQRCLSSLLAQDYPKDRMEIIIVTTEPRTLGDVEPGCPVKLMNGGPANPAEARNLAIKEAKGELIAMVDDDCIVPPNWLKSGVSAFTDSKVAVVGGPALTPKGVPLPRRIPGLLFSSRFGTSSMASRYVNDVRGVREASEVDLILCNMFARKAVLEEVGGFDGKQVPCEENELCYRISKRGYKLLYSPNIIVWHGLRPFPRRIAKRVFNYATGRGVLISRYPDMLNVVFIVPSIFVIGLVLGPLLSLFFPILWYPFSLALLIYFLVSLYYSLRVYSNERDKRLLALLPAGFLICHLSYGLGFLYGVYAFLTGEWKRKRLWE